MKSCLILPQQQQPSCWQPRVQSGLSSSWHRGVEAHEPGEQQQTWDRQPRSDDKEADPVHLVGQPAAAGRQNSAAGRHQRGEQRELRAGEGIVAKAGEISDEGRRAEAAGDIVRAADRKTVVEGKSVSVRGDHGGGLITKKKNKKT